MMFMAGVAASSSATSFHLDFIFIPFPHSATVHSTSCCLALVLSFLLLALVCMFSHFSSESRGRGEEDFIDFPFESFFPRFWLRKDRWGEGGSRFIIFLFFCEGERGANRSVLSTIFSISTFLTLLRCDVGEGRASRFSRINNQFLKGEPTAKG